MQPEWSLLPLKQETIRDTMNAGNRKTTLCLHILASGSDGLLQTKCSARSVGSTFRGHAGPRNSVSVGALILNCAGNFLVRGRESNAVLGTTQNDRMTLTI